MRWGVYKSPYGMVYGNSLVQNKGAKPLIIAEGKGCIAAAGPNNTAFSNSKWCCNPERCAKIGCDAHDINKAITADSAGAKDLAVVKLTPEQLKEKGSWQVIVKPHAAFQKLGDERVEAPPPPWRITYGPVATSPYPKTKLFERQSGGGSRTLAESSGTYCFPALCLRRANQPRILTHASVIGKLPHSLALCHKHRINKS